MTVSTEHSLTLLHTAASVIRVCLGGRAGFFAAFDENLYKPAGCFVSLHRKQTHVLRGCVGRIGTKDPLFRLIRASASSVLQDPRFTDNPVLLAELSDMELEVSLLSPFAQRANTLDFDLLNEGILLTFQGRNGLFLPQVARETGWTREQLLDRLCQEKLGVAAQAWRDPRASLQTFTTTILGPTPMDQLGLSDADAISPPPP